MVLKTIGQVLGYITFLAIGFFLIQGTILENLWVIVLAFALNISVLIILPKIFPNSNTLSSVKEGLHSAGLNINHFVVSLALIVVYIFGVGSVWLISRIVRKKFIQQKNNGWIIKKEKVNLEEMF